MIPGIYPALTPPPVSGPAPIIVTGVATNITSPEDRLISYRQQEHSLITSDGHVHILVNVGSVVLLSSSNGGLTWSQSATLADTGPTSTSDAWLVDSSQTLWICYSTSGGIIMNRVLHYAAGTWSNVATETIYSDPAYFAENPCQAIDGSGAVWCSFPTTAVSGGSHTIRLIRRSSGGVWTDTGLTFGPSDSFPQVQRSARPIRIPGGVGMVYTVRDDMYWGTHQNTSSPTTPWATRIIFTDTSGDTDPYSSHFSLHADSHNNIHLATVSGGALLYFKWLNSTKLWGHMPCTHGGNKATYPQVCVMSDDTPILMVNNQYAYVGVLQFDAADIDLPISPSTPLPFLHTYSLRHPPNTPAITNPNPRVECPGSVMSPGPIPTWVQFQNTDLAPNSQGLWYYSFSESL